MSATEPSDSNQVSPRAVKCGRFVLCLAGAILLSVAGWFAYTKPHSKILLTSTVLCAGFVLVWLGVALPPKAAAHVGLWLPWFLPSE